MNYSRVVIDPMLNALGDSEFLSVSCAAGPDAGAYPATYWWRQSRSVTFRLGDIVFSSTEHMGTHLASIPDNAAAVDAMKWHGLRLVVKPGCYLFLLVDTYESCRALEVALWLYITDQRRDTLMMELPQSTAVPESQKDRDVEPILT